MINLKSWRRRRHLMIRVRYTWSYSYRQTQRQTETVNNSITVIIIMIFLLAMTIIPCVLCLDLNPAKCPEGWEQGVDKCYKYHGYNLTFFEARIVCNDFYDGSTLLTVKSQPQQLYVTSLLFNHFNIKRDVWLGLRRVNHSHFRWLDGEETTEFTNWGPNEPSDATTFCVAMNQKQANFAKWYDRGCRELYPVVCQKNLTKEKQETAITTDGTSRKLLNDHHDLMSRHMRRQNVQMIFLTLLCILILLFLAAFVFSVRNKSKSFTSSPFPVMSYKNPLCNIDQENNLGMN